MKSLFEIYQGMIHDAGSDELNGDGICVGEGFWKMGIIVGARRGYLDIERGGLGNRRVLGQRERVPIWNGRGFEQIAVIE